jgi:hypothetical protein
VRKVKWDSVLLCVWIEGPGVGTRLLMVDVEVGEDATALKPSVGSKRTCVGVRVSYGMRMLDCGNIGQRLERCKESTYLV